MARINIEETWWTEPRRETLALLLGNQHETDTVIIKLWKQSQTYWQRGLLIPGHVFIYLHGALAILDAGLARVYETPKIWLYPDPSEKYENVPQRPPNDPERPPNDPRTILGSVRDLRALEPYFIYACGTREHHFWLIKGLLQRVEAGKKSVAKRRLMHGTAQPQAQPRMTALVGPQKVLEIPERDAFSFGSRSNDSRTTPNAPEPSYSSSYSLIPRDPIKNGPILNKEVKNKQEQGPSKEDSPELNFEALYLKYPRRLGSQRKADGLRTCKRKFKTIEAYQQLEQAIMKYAKHCRDTSKVGTELVSQFKTFVGEVWEEWAPQHQDAEALARRQANERAVAESRRKLELEAQVAEEKLDRECSVDPETAQKAVAQIMNMGGFMKEMPKPRFREGQ